MIEAYNKEVFKRDMVTSVSSYIGSMQKLKRVELMDGHILSEIEIPGEIVNKSLRELNLRSRFGIEVVLIKQSYDEDEKEKQKVIPPKPDYKFKFGDSVLVMGTQESIDRIQSLNGKEY